MMHLTFTINQDTEGNDRFKVYAPSEDEEVKEITEDYDLMAVQSKEGREGFAVFKKIDPQLTDMEVEDGGSIDRCDSSTGCGRD